MLLKLIIQKSLKKVLVFSVNETIVEDAKNFVTPQLDDLLFGLVEVFICEVQPLEHFGNVTHVEHIVRFGRRGQESLTNLME